MNAKISHVHNGSLADRAGIRKGDELVSIDSEPVLDILDYRYRTTEERFTMRFRRGEQEYIWFVHKDCDEDLGIEFEEEMFDGLRRCQNNCIFCFLKQMPKGLRESLYVNDDDYRLSFAHGNYVTLTNLRDSDVERIITQRMSQFYVSVHATDPELRVFMMGNKKAGRIMEQLRIFADAGVTIHAQAVLCPGVNDGAHLERTVFDLASLYPSVASIAIVPVGLTKHRKGLSEIRPVDAQIARTVVESCSAWQDQFLASLGTRLVFPSDEFYLLARQEFPSSEEYEGFPQLEDGVGGSRLFLDELEELMRAASETSCSGSVTLVTGTLAAPLVDRLADTLRATLGVKAKVCPINNEFLGNSVTVSGLLSGHDIEQGLKSKHIEGDVLIPSVAINGDRFLDDMTVSDLARSLGANVVVVEPSPLAVVEHIRGAVTTREVIGADTECSRTK